MKRVAPWPRSHGTSTRPPAPAASIATARSGGRAGTAHASRRRRMASWGRMPVSCCGSWRSARRRRRPTWPGCLPGNLAVARLTYALSVRSAVYAGVGRMDNHGAAAIALDAGGTTAPGKAQSGVMAGLRHAF